MRSTQQEVKETPTRESQQGAAQVRSRSRRWLWLLLLLGIGVVIAAFLFLGDEPDPGDQPAPAVETEVPVDEEEAAEEPPVSVPLAPYEVQYTESDNIDEREFLPLDGATLDGPLNLYVGVPEDEAAGIEQIELFKGDELLWDQVTWPYGDEEPVSLEAGEHSVYGLLTYTDGTTERTPVSTFTVSEAAAAAEPEVPTEQFGEAEPLGQAVGFARDVTGGAGGEVYWVTTTADDGPGSFRQGVHRDGPTWIRFAVEGTIFLETDLHVGSNVTIDGRDSNVTFSGSGLILDGAENVIITNVTFAAGEGDMTDAVRIINGTEGVWIYHCTFADYPDGLIDITRGSTDVTVAYNEFTDHVKVMLINDEEPQDEPARVTVHHNLFDGTFVRHPKARWAHVHLFNNYIRNWSSDGHGSAVEADTDAEIYSEQNIFEAGRIDRAIISADDADPRGRISSSGDLLLGGADIQEHRSGSVFDPYAYYDASPEEATPQLAERIAAEAGVLQSED